MSRPAAQDAGRGREGRCPATAALSVGAWLMESRRLLAMARPDLLSGRELGTRPRLEEPSTLTPLRVVEVELQVLDELSGLTELDRSQILEDRLQSMRQLSIQSQAGHEWREGSGLTSKSSSVLGPWADR